MRRLAMLLVLAAVAAAGYSAWRWPPDDAAGFVEVKRGFAAFDPRDVVRLNGADVLRAAANPEAAASVVVRQKAGPVQLDYARGDVARTLCSFTLRKNRIVTATLTQTRGGIACAVKT
jgi:hypothetical protein